MSKYLFTLLFSLTLMGAGCSSVFTRSIPQVDVSLATCETIEEFRLKVADEYGAKIERISDLFFAARRSFQDQLN